jgi:hypothetical protein
VIWWGCAAAQPSRAATTGNSPQFQLRVKRQNKPSPARAAELHNAEIFCRPCRGFSFSRSLRAIFFRACGAKTFDSPALLLSFSAVHFSIARLAAKI